MSDTEAANKSSQLSIVSVFFLAQFACLLYVTMQATFKDLQLRYDVTVAEIALMRSSYSLIFTLILVCICGKNPTKEVRRDQIVPLIVRCLSGTTAFIVVTMTVKMIPLTIFQVITNVTPFISGLLACVWLGERLSWFQFICMLFCFSGIVLVTLSKGDSGEDAGSDDQWTEYETGVILAASITLVFALSSVSTRRIRDLHFSVI